MSILGVVAAKDKSTRFEKKNMRNYKGEPLFWHNVKAMLKIGIKPYVITDSKYIKNYSESRGVDVIDRNYNISHCEQSIFDVYKFAHWNLPKYDIMVTILANTINVESKDIQKAISLLRRNKLKEVRSYNKGVENGLAVFDKSVFDKHEISSYVGAIETKAKEIHYESEIKTG